MNILRLHGTDEELYKLVAPLVMDYRVIKHNLGFPFRTSGKYTWFIATDDEGHVLGFMPVEKKAGGPIINNYYVADNNEEVLEGLLQAVVNDNSLPAPLSAMAFIRDGKLFQRYGFETHKEWKRYFKMIKA